MESDEDVELNYPSSSDEGDDGEEEPSEGAELLIVDKEGEGDSEGGFGGAKRTPRHMGFTVLGSEEIQHRQQEAITRLSAVLDLPHEETEMVLRHYKWNEAEASEKWFQDAGRVRREAGLLPADAPRKVGSGADAFCGICCEETEAVRMVSVGCGHYFCEGCYARYMEERLGEGLGAMEARCPGLEKGGVRCQAKVPPSVAKRILGEEGAAKYEDFRQRAYVEGKAGVRWCPGAGCGRAVEGPVGWEVEDVACRCGEMFCWACGEEAHRPVDCETVKKWVEKTSVESENLNWILLNTKQCPKCKRPIEKNQGCMHMTCYPPCKHEFCWLCLGDWKDHGERTGGFYACNRYRGETSSVEAKRRERAKNSLERYTHYFERWINHNAAHRKALSDIRHTSDEWLRQLGEHHGVDPNQLRFIVDALRQVAECRRVLKWTYAFAYYRFMPEDGAEGALPPGLERKKEFFEFIQGEAEAQLELLTEEAETELKKQFEMPDHARLSFSDFRSAISSLTDVTRKYFGTLVSELEHGLPGGE